MKKFFALTIALVVLGAGSAFALISGSSHDFSGAAWSGGEICAPCHTPHNALSSTTAPLWAHTTTQETFTPYAGIGTYNSGATAPGGVSLACLSCHDGVTAMDGFVGSSAGIDGATTMASGVVGNLGTDLTNDHPVSITYDGTLVIADGALHNPATLDTAVSLFSNKIECATCHDVHNGTGFDSMLVLDNAGSNLCLECHNK